MYMFAHVFIYTKFEYLEIKIGKKVWEKSDNYLLFTFNFYTFGILQFTILSYLLFSFIDIGQEGTLNQSYI